MARRCEVLTTDQTWRETLIRDLRIGDVFRLREPSGSLYADEEGCQRWRVAALPAPNDDGTCDVDAEALPETSVERSVSAQGYFWPGEGPRLPRSDLGRSRLKG